jgi:hypothetical protein
MIESAVNFKISDTEDASHVTQIILSRTGLSVLWVEYATHNTLKSVPILPR